jgi:isopenicillin N synthase-like dioxygenase
MEEMKSRNFHLREGKEESYTNGDTSLEDLDPGLNWWPKRPIGYREKTERLHAELGKVGDTLLDVISESLGLPPTYLRLEHHKNATVPRYMIFHYYPKSMSSTVDETGLLPHRDSSIFTIVSQGYSAPGLMINPYGKWVPVNPQPGSLIVNVGDILAVCKATLYNNNIWYKLNPARKVSWLMEGQRQAFGPSCLSLQTTTYQKFCCLQI